MKNKKLSLAISLLTAFLLSFVIAGEIKDYLNAGNEITFNNDKYTLAWSSHPSANYYKQEYIMKGETPEAHHKMMMLEAVAGNLTIKDAVKTKVQELETRKKWDYVANYKVYENDNKQDEAIIDFCMSDTNTIYEWNLYRYQLQKGTDNKKHLVLFAYSYQDILNDDKDLKKFFDNIKKNRADFINQLQAYPIPKVAVKE